MLLNKEIKPFLSAVYDYLRPLFVVVVYIKI